MCQIYLLIDWLGVLRGLPRDFGVGPPSHHQSASAGGQQQQQPGSRGNRGNNRSDVSIQVSRSPVTDWNLANDQAAAAAVV